MNETVAVITLGCNKNLVDSEYMLGQLRQAGYLITNRPDEAEVIIVNTCGFVEAAKTEAVQTLFAALEHKKNKCRAVLAAGCLATRYSGKLMGEMPELDGILGVYDIPRLPEVIENALQSKKPSQTNGAVFYLDEHLPRVLSTPGHMAYLKIAEGCSNRCAYCAIPSIRGPYHSRPAAVLLKEAENLRQQGVKELLVTAQDSTRYGEGDSDTSLIALLKELSGFDFTWIRLLYAYPSRVSFALLDFMEETESICKYIDMPIQHTENRLLQAMNRHYSRETVEQIYRHIRSYASNWAIRTTVITGFPGETEAEFQSMLSFLGSHPFDHLGAFAYSREEGTPAARQKQVKKSERTLRMDSVMLRQGEISHRLNQARVGETHTFVCEGINEANEAVGRISLQAPETDGITVLPAPLPAGTFARVRITDAFGYDFTAELL